MTVYEQIIPCTPTTPTPVRNVDVPPMGTPEVVDDGEKITVAIEHLISVEGPIAVDTERASSFRYTNDAYLVQIKRGTGNIILLDPVALSGKIGRLAQAIDGPQWILHSAAQDITAMSALGISPRSLYDTEVAAEIIGDPQIGLAALVENALGVHLAKEHSAVNWSSRPLPIDWLNYAAIDVEYLAALQEKQIERLVKYHRLEWAKQEFEHIRLLPPKAKKADPWRKLKYASSVETGRGRQVLKNLYEARDTLAKERDLSAHLILSPQAIVSAAIHIPKSQRQIGRLPEFRSKTAKRRLKLWWRHIEKAYNTAPELYPPSTAPKLPGELPKPRSWRTFNAAGAARLELLKAAVNAAADEARINPPRLLENKIMRRISWDGVRNISIKTVGDKITSLGARPWQVELLAPLVAEIWK